MQRDYTYFDLTISICSKCLERIPAKIIFRGEQVWMQKQCAKHGKEEVMISDDVDYYLRCRNYMKPSEMPHRFQTPVKHGCPYDCGLCADHEQHSCLTLIELTDRCNLSCPTCYASSGPQAGSHRSLEVIETMLDNLVASEGEPDVVQLSGGEPTLHPQFFEILDAAKQRPIKHIMLNTNGIRIANDEDFVDRLANYRKNFEVYLQFDSLKQRPIQELRGADLLAIRHRALEQLNARNISTTLVVTVKRDLNENELGEIIDFAAKIPCVRGVTFQPLQHAGRHDDGASAKHRISLSEVRRKIGQQTDLFTLDDLVPVPCNPDYLCMAYGLKTKDGVQPLTRHIDPSQLIEGAGNTIIFEQNPELQATAMRILSTGATPETASCDLRELLCCLPMIKAPEDIVYSNVFRIIIMEFMDAFNFDVRGVKKSCVHIAHPDGRIIPFETMNIFYREGLEATVPSLFANQE